MNFDRVRTLILQQAIRGRLVTHIDTEKPVHVNNKVTLNVPYELPETWLWVRGDEILEFIRGVTFPASAKQSSNSEGTVRCLTTGSVQRLHNPVADVFIQSSYVKKDRQYLQKNDIVISTANSKELVGKCIRWKNVDSKVSFGGFLTVARSKNSEIDSNFVYYVFQSLFYSRYFANLSTQTTNIANLSNALLSGVLFPVPPIEEQLRIVTKLDEAFAEIDRAEKAYQELQTLSGVLRGQILHEAIQGKLVPQLDSEGAVEQIGDAPEEVPFTIPEKWKWTCLEKVADFYNGYAFKSSSYVDQSLNQVIRLGNVKMNRLELEVKPVFVSDKVSDSQSLFHIKPNDILVTMTGTKNKKDYFYSTLVLEADLKDRKLLLNQRVGCIRAKEKVLPEFLCLVLQEKTIRDGVLAQETGTANQGNISSSAIKFIKVPIPPKDEQKRIVDSINSLMEQIEALSRK